MNAAPILLFVYARPEHTRRVLFSLLSNKLAEKSILYIYSDGARSETDRKSVDEVRKIINNVKGFKQVYVVERTENFGLAQNIIDGVTSLVNRYGRIIVLEDDLVVSPYFLDFMNDALETYEDEPRVGHIQACDFTGDASLPDTFLIKWTGSWGWATWRRAWALFNPDGKYLLKEIYSRKLDYTFDFDGKYPYTRMLRRQTEGKNNSWAIRWNASLFLADILSLNVGKSLVANTGFDGSGTNCGGGNLFKSNIYDKRLPVIKIDPIEENALARKVYSKYYARNYSFWAKAVRRIKRTLKGDFKR